MGCVPNTETTTETSASESSASQRRERLPLGTGSRALHASRPQR